jgi:hypothetical protein
MTSISYSRARKTLLDKFPDSSEEEISTWIHFEDLPAYFDLGLTKRYDSGDSNSRQLFNVSSFYFEQHEVESFSPRTRWLNYRQLTRNWAGGMPGSTDFKTVIEAAHNKNLQQSSMQVLLSLEKPQNPTLICVEYDPSRCSGKLPPAMAENIEDGVYLRDQVILFEKFHFNKSRPVHRYAMNRRPDDLHKLMIDTANNAKEKTWELPSPTELFTKMLARLNREQESGYPSLSTCGKSIVQGATIAHNSRPISESDKSYHDRYRNYFSE